MRKAAVLVVALVLGCNSAPGPVAWPLDKNELALLRERVAAHLKAETLVAWRRWTGQNEAQGAPATDLADADLSVVLQHEGDGAPNSRAFLYLRAYLLSEHIKRATADIDAAMASVRQHAQVQFANETLPYAKLPVALATQASPQSRHELAQAALPTLRQLQDLAWERQQQERNAARALGKMSAAELAQALQVARLAPRVERARAFLPASLALYRVALTTVAKEQLNMEVADLSRADLPRLWRAPAYDSLFPASRLTTMISETLAGMGINRATLPVVLDLTPRPNKSLRPACFPVDPGRDIRISLLPQGGVGDYEALLHEAGHALQLAFTRQPSFELAVLGDGATSESYALLLANIVGNPAWLADHGVDEPARSSLARLLALRRLLLARKSAAMLLASVDAFDAGSKAEMLAIYQRALSEALDFDVDTTSALQAWVGADRFFKAADYFDGWLLSAQLADVLASKLGERWWREHEGGAFLRRLWAAGQEPLAAELAQQTAGTPLTDDALLHSIARTLSGSARVEESAMRAQQ